MDRYCNNENVIMIINSFLINNTIQFDIHSILNLIEKIKRRS
jgi:hypothetical protein